MNTRIKPRIALSLNGGLYFCWVPFNANVPYVGSGVTPKLAYENWKEKQDKNELRR